MTQTLAQAVAIFKDEVDRDLLEIYENLRTTGKARWKRDPYWPGVYGLVKGGNTLVVVYANGSWAASDRFVDMLDR